MSHAAEFVARNPEFAKAIAREVIRAGMIQPGVVGLTRKQRIVLDFIKVFWQEKDYSPSITDIMAGVGSKSRSVIWKTVKSLEDRGYLVSRRSRGSKKQASRSIRIATNVE